MMPQKGAQVTIVLTRFYGLESDIPEDKVALRGPYRDEHREDQAGQQAEDLWTWMVLRDRQSPQMPLNPSAPCEGPVVDSQFRKFIKTGLWVHKKGGLYTVSGDCYFYAGDSLPAPGMRVEYVSLDNTLRPGTRWSLREAANFRERFIYLGTGFPVAWNEVLAHQVCEHLGITGLGKLASYNDPENFLWGIYSYLQD
jgi:hypothetical protein